MSDASFYDFASAMLPDFVQGFVVNLLIAAIAMLVGLAVGAPLARGQAVEGGMGFVSALLAFLLRATAPPLLAMVIFFGYAPSSLGPLSAVLIAFCVASPGFVAETLRAAQLASPQPTGALANDPGARIAARRRAWAIALPGLTNQFLLMLYLTLTASLAGVADLGRQAARVTAQTFKADYAYGLALLLTFVAALIIQIFSRRLERRLRAS